MSENESEPGCTTPRQEIPDRYTTLRMEESTVIYDVENHSTWVESDTIVPLEEAR